MSSLERTAKISRYVNSLQQPTEVVTRLAHEKNLGDTDDAHTFTDVTIARVRDAQIVNVEARRNIVRAYRYTNRPILRRLY